MTKREKMKKCAFTGKDFPVTETGRLKINVRLKKGEKIIWVSAEAASGFLRKFGLVNNKEVEVM